MALMQQAQQRVNQSKAGKGFKRPTIPVSPEQRDAVDRIVAAGMKLMYSPGMAEQRKKAISEDQPVAMVLAQNVTGLTLVMDQQTQGGLPMEAIFPAAMELLSDAAEMFTKAGKTVTQDDYNDAARIMYVLIGKKLGVTDDDLMAGAEQAAGGQAGEEGPEEPGEAAEGETPPQEAAEEQLPEGMEDQQQGVMP